MQNDKIIKENEQKKKMLSDINFSSSWLESLNRKHYK